MTDEQQNKPARARKPESSPQVMGPVTLQELQGDKWFERLRGLADEAAEPVGVDPKVLALVSLALDASPSGMYPQGMRKNIRRALSVGASLNEIVAVLRLVSLSGQHSLSLGISILEEELAVQQYAPGGNTKRNAQP